MSYDKEKRMIDLHLHLDGSLSPEFVLSEYKAQGIELPCPEKDFGKLLKSKGVKSLNEYLKAFEYPLTVLQTESALSSAYESLLNNLDKCGLAYVEIRFAPQLHTRKGLSQQDVVEAVLKARAKSDCFVENNVILCCMRGDDNDKENTETVELCKAYNGQGVVGVDLAGAEALFPTSKYGELFKRANKYGIPITIHAGEAAGSESVKAALDMGARRIGHGVRIANDTELLKRIAKERIGIEMCLTSNLDTHAINGIDEFPIIKYLDLGILASVNTDDMTVSDTTIDKEFERLKPIGVTDSVKRKLISNAFETRF